MIKSPLDASQRNGFRQDQRRRNSRSNLVLRADMTSESGHQYQSNAYFADYFHVPPVSDDGELAGIVQ